MLFRSPLVDLCRVQHTAKRDDFIKTKIMPGRHPRREVDGELRPWWRSSMTTAASFEPRPPRSMYVCPASNASALSHPASGCVCAVAGVDGLHVAGERDEDGLVVAGGVGAYVLDSS